MIVHKTLLLTILIGFFAACTQPDPKSETAEMPPSSPATNRVVLSSEVQWEALNPARGDKSPKAGTLWGNRKGGEATGFLAKFIDGFSSPPHIHNVTYRAVVLQGLIHNDDPNAEKMWMPTGSFWTQPAGEIHITAAKGTENMAYVEIDAGPYLVRPTGEAFDNGEKPINIDRSNLIWLDVATRQVVATDQPLQRPAVAFLWKNKELKGQFVQLPAGFKGAFQSEGAIFHAIVIEGKLDYTLPQNNKSKPLDMGSYFTSEGPSEHSIEVDQASNAIFYLRTDGAIEF